MGFEPLQYDEVIPDPRTQAYIFRFKASIPMIDKNHLAYTGLEYCRCRNNELPPQRRLQIDIHEHSRLQRNAGIIDRQPHLDGTCRHIDLRQDLFDAALKTTPRISVNRDGGTIPVLQSANVVLKDLRVDPDSR